MTKPYIVRDKYFHRAKEQKLRARSAFKLDEIQQRFRLVKKKQTVVDLGAAPGSWSQRLAQWVGDNGMVIAMDLQEIEPIGENVVIYQVDITDEAMLDILAIERVDGVVADLAPKTTGMKDVDAYHSAELNHAVLTFCDGHLSTGGYLVTKIFHGEDFDDVLKRTRKGFKQVKCFKPKACRDRSRETYIVGMGFKGGPKS